MDNAPRGAEGTESASPLAGLRVLDLTRVLAGPYLTALLADVGAEVIKIEAPGRGDDARHFAPFHRGESGYFMLINRGKKSVTLNLKDARGVALLHRLAANSDVVVENFRPGVAERLGVGYRRLAALNPRLVYVSVSGFGQEGPLAARPAYDIVAQAMSGLMSLTGSADGPPTRVGESIGDLVAALFGAWATMVALAARERTGRGQHVDVAMVDSLFSLMLTGLSQYLYGGVVPGRVGNRHPLSTPFDVYPAADGHVVIAVATDALFARLAELIGRPELAADPRFASDAERTRHEPELTAIISAWTGRRTVAEALAGLEDAGIPASPILSLAAAAESDHAAARGLLRRVHHPVVGDIRMAPQPVHFSAAPQPDPGPPPTLGADTEAVLGELLGLGREEIATLARERVI